MEVAPFQVESARLDGDLQVIEVRGELDLGTAPEFETVLVAATTEPSGRVIIDLEHCGFVDSTGIAMIINAWRRVEGDEAANGRLVLCSPSDQVARLFEVTGLTGSIAISASRQHAVSEIAA